MKAWNYTSFYWTALVTAQNYICLLYTLQTHSHLTSIACRKSWGISERSHWFQGLSLSTSSRDDGMSKSPTDEYGTSEHELFSRWRIVFVIGSHLGQWNGSQNCEGAGKQTLAVSGAATPPHFRCCCWAGRPEPVPWTPHHLWSKKHKTSVERYQSAPFL